jgi:hypothetical protein
MEPSGDVRVDSDLRKRFLSMKNEMSMSNEVDENKLDTDDDEDTSQDVSLLLTLASKRSIMICEAFRSTSGHLNF